MEELPRLKTRVQPTLNPLPVFKRPPFSLCLQLLSGGNIKVACMLSEELLQPRWVETRILGSEHTKGRRKRTSPSVCPPSSLQLCLVTLDISLAFHLK